MKIGILYFPVLLLISWAHVDGRNVFPIEDAGKLSLEYVSSYPEPVNMDLMSEEVVPVLEQLPPEFICESCLAVSRKVVEILNDPKLLETAGVISTKICRMLPSDKQLKCLEMSEMYVHQAILSLQKYFCEENLCNSTGLCTGDGKTILAMNVDQQSRIHSWILKQIHMLRFNNKISDEKSCTACHDAMNEILKELQNPETKLKVLQTLLKACENVKNHVKECKKLVFEYAPLVLANLEKLVTNNDLCSILHICDGAPPHHVEEGANAYALPLIQLPHAKHLRCEPAASACM